VNKRSSTLLRPEEMPGFGWSNSDPVPASRAIACGTACTSPRLRGEVGARSARGEGALPHPERSKSRIRPLTPVPPPQGGREPCGNAARNNDEFYAAATLPDV
jgi:hypothetical protein